MDFHHGTDESVQQEPDTPSPIDTTIDTTTDATAQPMALEIVKAAPPRKDTIPGSEPFPCEISRKTWYSIGDMVVERESQPLAVVPGHQWITLRLDGVNFSRGVRQMRRLGLLPEPSDTHSATLETTMRETMLDLMRRVGAVVGYTQSDEMTVCIPPRPVVRGVQEPHLYSGRTTKLTTIASGYVSSRFLYRLLGNRPPPDGMTDIPCFDCRLAAWDSWPWACNVLLWRARDCGINGVSDAVHRLKHVSGRKQAMTKGTLWKLRWLCEQHKLPLPSHQQFGSICVRRRHCLVQTNPKTKESVEVHRFRYDWMAPGTSLIALARDGRLDTPNLQSE